MRIDRNAQSLSTLSRVGIVAVAAVSAISAACSTSPPPGGSAAAAEERVRRGQALYGELCATCHGTRGEGASGPSLREGARPEADLAARIDARMPLGAPERCDAACAADIAAFIVATLRGPITCDAAPASPRQLRLLTRREYRATVADLFRSGAPSAPTSACTPHTFSFNATGRAPRSVHIAGSFNGWPKTIAGGGWPLAPAAGNLVWSAQRNVPAGIHTYKLVVDENEWLTDPKNPNHAPDGQGGQNSVLNVAPCGAAADEDDPTKAFPAETHPEGFAFDDDARGRVVTSVHAEEYLRAATSLAKRAAEALVREQGCDASREAPRCAEGFLAKFGARAFRRPLTTAETARYRAVVLASPRYEDGIVTAIRALLTSPSFLYRSELGERQTDGSYRLTPHEIASALSYMFWGTMPDDTLFAAATRGDLARPDGIEREARRLLADPRSRAMIGHFAVQWLGAEGVVDATKNEGAYPSFTKEVRAAMLEETRRFVTHVVFDGSHGYDELVTAGYSFVNEPLARQYGMSGVTGPALAKQPLPEARRAGILAHGSVLATTAHSDQSSPIRRGLFVRRSLLCQELGAPPPSAGGVPKVDPSATTRERFRQHTDQPACASCHQYIDPVGFGFERFDAIGAWRDTEAGHPIDASGDMNDVERLGAGTHAPFTSLPELGKTLAQSDSAKSCFVRQMYRFSRGFKEGADELCTIQTLGARFRERGGDIRELMIAITQMSDFVVRR